MAKKKKRSGKSKGRRMGAVALKKNDNETLLMIGGGVLLGGIAKGFLDQVIAKQETLKIDQKTVDMLEVAAGAAGAYFLDGWFFKGLGIGLASSAGLSILREMDVIKGVGLPPLVPFRPRPRMSNLNGATRTPSLGAGNVYGFPKPPGVGRAMRRKVSSY